MAKLTIKQRNELQRAQCHLVRAMEYINRPDIAIGVLRKGPATTTLHYVRDGDGDTFYALDKEIDSNLAGLSMACSALTSFLATS